jgi:hypothetical protein
MKAGQQWKMTLQNAGLGYYGYLDSPSGKNLPRPIGNTPGGAQFKLETQAEIKAQPPWLVAVEKALGSAALLVGLAVLTGGEGDADLEAIKIARKTGDIADGVLGDESILEYSIDGSMDEEGNFIAHNEIVSVDSFVEGLDPNAFGYAEVDAEGYFNLEVDFQEPQIVEVEALESDESDDALNRGFIWPPEKGGPIRSLFRPRISKSAWTAFFSES